MFDATAGDRENRTRQAPETLNESPGWNIRRSKRDVRRSFLYRFFMVSRSNIQTETSEGFQGSSQ